MLISVCYDICYEFWGLHIAAYNLLEVRVACHNAILMLVNCARGRRATLQLNLLYMNRDHEATVVAVYLYY